MASTKLCGFRVELKAMEKCNFQTYGIDGPEEHLHVVDGAIMIK